MRLAEADARTAVRRLRRDLRRAHPRGRRVLRRDPARPRPTPTPARAAPGVRRNDLEQAVLLLRHAASGCNGDATQLAPPAQRQHGPQPRMGASQQRRHHLDAGQVGVPVVRRVGPRVPLHSARADRPGVRQGAARAAHARVVHASERADARLRVGVRRRQSAGARLGDLARVPDRSQAARRRRRPAVPRARVPQADAELHLVGESQGRRRPQRLPGRLPRPRQHRRLRPQRARCRPAGTSTRPTARAGWRCMRST